MTWNALFAFEAKCGLGNPYALDRFGSTGARGIMLARVAVWAALRDRFDVAYGLTAGQITTVTDGAPLVVGEAGLARLGRCASRSDLEGFLESKSGEWWPAISGLSEWWGIRMRADVGVTSILQNSKSNQRDMARLAVVLWHMGEGNPLAEARGLHEWIEASSQILGAEDRPSSKWAMAQAAAGRWQDLMDSPTWGNELPPLPTQQASEEESGIYTFPGRGTVSEYQNRALTLRSRALNQSFEAYLASSPAGSYPLIQAKQFAPEAVDRDDLFAAALRGYHEALIRYSPIVTPTMSMWDVSADERNKDAKIGQATLFAEDSAARRTEWDGVVYVPSRFAAFAADTYMRKYLIQAAQSLKTISPGQEAEDEVSVEGEDIRGNSPHIFSLDQMVTENRSVYDYLPDDRREEEGTYDPDARELGDGEDEVVVGLADLREASAPSEILAHKFDTMIGALEKKGRLRSARTLVGVANMNVPKTQMFRVLERDLQDVFGDSRMVREYLSIVRTASSLVGTYRKAGLQDYTPELGRSRGEAIVDAVTHAAEQRGTGGRGP
ncbi:MAG: hypothetical protein E6Q40_13045 [Cupriavidus sp.]|nr:MAG: hypothetical protein E6Q40_13045 [Cupriavidus sp.]